MYKQSEETISQMDGVLVLNFDKVVDGVTYKNYIGGATFLEIYDAFRMNKKIYMYNDIPDGILFDELQGFAPIILNGDLSKMFETIAVSGTHGKTTTSTMIYHILKDTTGCNYFIGDGSGYSYTYWKWELIKKDS
jgi:Asp-tRNA(Asn)/Glu-tRNA(Gln) amidotransferase B subunit